MLPEGSLPSEQPERKRKPIESFRKNHKGLSITQRCQLPADVVGWAQIGIARRVLTGKRWNDIAAEIKVKPADLYRYYQSPGGKAFAERIKEQRDAMTDPVQIARLGAMMEAPYWQQEAFCHYLAVKEANDYAEMGRTIRHMLKVTGVEQPENKLQGPAVIVINNSQAPQTVELQMGDSSFTKVLDAEIVE